MKHSKFTESQNVAATKLHESGQAVKGIAASLLSQNPDFTIGSKIWRQEG
jgi:hypothetical protein